ncbi:polyprenyl synthetase family protein [Campylobacter sp. FMV-PI01]|uniref:Polyprenyl synthetase family protein n=1 Tax=Campylobacter portucalensis TaxID=2608384 RepID=A0A6L5WFU5_9BACT|nr:polyprenyl synthetase family protein [Campylobacter portucalensis]MSN95980.1 polyprenyl synthetase family protein [Campylobacter portucalensis]
MKNLEKIDTIMRKFISELGYEEVNFMFNDISLGKKLRSKLILNIAGCFEESLRLCAVVELIHVASLLHDDVIDDSNLRRGKPSINAIFGVKNAIMLGDILYSKGFFELSKFDSKIAKIISNSVAFLSIGELMDVNLSKNFNLNLDNYFNMIYNKTAILIEACAKSAAILAGYDYEKFGIYGKNLGLAFQIIDDVLDIISDEKTLGKPSMSDFRDGKTTIAYIYLYQYLDEKDKKKLISLFRKNLNLDEIFWLKSKFDEFKIIQKCINEAKKLAKDGIESISQYKNDKLIEIMQSMVDRDF